MSEERALPTKVRQLAGSAPLQLIWRNELGGETFRAVDGRHIKWQPLKNLDPERSADVDLVVEADKLRWAGRFVRVPPVLDGGVDEDGAWLVTEALDATSAFDPRWRDRPEVAVVAIATGLRRLHDTLPVDKCPYPASWPGPTAAAPIEPDRLVVCHGDPCVPNTVIDRNGEFAGHVDLAQLGIADRWADLAIATYSIGWDFNFGRNYDDLFFEVYGVAPDSERIRIYRELWDQS